MISLRRTCRAAALVLTLAAGIAVGLSAAAPASPRPVDPANRAELMQLLSVLDTLVTKGPQSSEAYKTYMRVRDRMQAARILFVTDDASAPAGRLQSTWFSPNPGGVCWGVVSPLLLRTARSDPGLALALLMNTVAMADSYFASPDGFSAEYADPVGGFLLSMDALYVQAVFIRDFVRPAYPKASAYETFLTDSLANDNLSSASMFILGIDSGLVYGLRRLDAEVAAGSTGINAWFDRVDALGREVLLKLDQATALAATAAAAGATSDDRNLARRNGYIAAIGGLSLLNHGSQVIGTTFTRFPESSRQAAASRIEAFDATREAVAAKARALAAPAGGRVLDYRAERLAEFGL